MGKEESNYYPKGNDGTQPELPAFPVPNQYPSVLPDNPVNLNQQVYSAKPGDWKKNIRDYWSKIQYEKGEDAVRIPRLRSFIECSGNLVPQLPQLSLDQPGSVSFTVGNRGNYAAWTCYVELYRGRAPLGTNTPLTDYELQDRKIITLQPGETKEMSLSFTRFTGLITAVAVCYDPLLDPKDFTVVETHRQITAGSVNIFDLP